MKNIYIGTSGYNYKHWKGRFYPKEIPVKSWLEYYSQHFNTVEINATFYGHFKKSVFESWAEKTPKNFVFTLKGPRFITHLQKLKDPKAQLDYFYNEAVGLGDKLSLILWQLPPSFKLTDETFDRLENFLKILPKINEVVEFRHQSWFTDKVFELLDKYGVGFVINDSTRWAQTEKVTGKVAYVRFHGPGRLYGSSYSDEQLEIWAKKIKKFVKDREVYCYFNNDGQAFAIKNAKTLQKFIV